MSSANLILHPAFAVAQVDPNLFGSFVEHLGRCVYGGIYEPGHSTATAEGFRGDVLELTREIGVPLMRYPGGNFVSGYNWKDGIGPKEQRPRRLELAWRTVETNQFGLNEFIDWCRAAGTEPFLAVNLGTGDPASAAALVEYCNHPGGSYWSDLRIAHGWKEPHRVKFWCLGNEMDGEWQLGHKTATEYGRIAVETGRMMRGVDPEIKLVACGSSFPGMPTYIGWDREVLRHTYDVVDYISLHRYFDNTKNNLGEFLTASLLMDRQIREINAVCDVVKAERKGKKDILLAFDEWNVWFHSHDQDKKVAPWQEAPPLIEDVYTLEDALVVGCLLITLLRHADRVKMACLAQLVNVIGAIFTRTGGGACRQTIFYPYRDASRHGRGEVLRAQLTSDRYTATGGEVDLLEIVPVLHREKGELVLFAVNRDQKEDLRLTADLRSFSKSTFLDHSILDGPDLKARNTVDAPETVQPRWSKIAPEVKDGVMEIALPPLSWNVVRISV
jgi:alpha-N-arabinofuranosidase